MILYLYSMESFIYSDINKACRNKDPLKIKYYGAFSAALSFIIDNANKNLKKTKRVRGVKLFRGLKMVPEEADSYQVGETVHLTGYTSTSKIYETALEFAFDEC